MELYDDIYHCDEEYMDEFAYSSILFSIIGLFETLLDDLAKDAARLANKSLNLRKYGSLSYVQKYIQFLIEDCGCLIDTSDEGWTAFDHVRRVRNSYVHKLGKDLPEKIQKEIQSFFGEMNEESFKLNYEFIDGAFGTVGFLASEIERAYYRILDQTEE